MNDSYVARNPTSRGDWVGEGGGLGGLKTLPFFVQSMLDPKLLDEMGKRTPLKGQRVYANDFIITIIYYYYSVPPLRLIREAAYSVAKAACC